MSPAPPSAVFLGKCVANFLFLLAAEIILAPLFFVFFDLSFRGSASLVPPVMLFGSWALVVNGTFFAALTANLRSRELMLPLILLPISVPALIAVVEATAGLIIGDESIQSWLNLLIGFDVIFTTLAIILFEVVLESE
jgi:heme exporter protein B